jgi:hypothetical protein
MDFQEFLVCAEQTLRVFRRVSDKPREFVRNTSTFLMSAGD